MVTIWFACGHRQVIAEPLTGPPPVCAECGTSRIEAVKAPPPRIRVTGLAGSGILWSKEDNAHA